jgi:hypothetical protein
VVNQVFDDDGDARQGPGVVARGDVLIDRRCSLQGGSLVDQRR